MKLNPEQIKNIKEEQKARWAKGLKAAGLEVVKFAKPAIVPTLKNGGDIAMAKALNKFYADAHNGMRRIVALGLFVIELKETKLKHGEFGPWLAAHCPKLATVDPVTGNPRPSRALSGYVDLTKSVLESIGFNTLEDYLKAIGKCAVDAHLSGGQFLLIPDKKVPESIREIRENIFKVVDGKTQKALFTEFKNALDDGKKQIGRKPGHGGASKAQRANAQELETQERITEKTLKAGEIAEWLIEMADDKGLGEIAGTPELAALDKAMETARGYIKHGGGK